MPIDHDTYEVIQTLVDRRFAEVMVRREEVDGVRQGQHRLEEAQAHTEVALQQLTVQVQHLEQAQARTDQSVQALHRTTDARFAELAQAVREQARTTDARFAELAQAQARTEQSVQELSQAQARTEQSVRELSQTQARTEQSVRELSQTQARTEQSVRDLSRSMQGMRQEIGALGNRLGSDLEEFALEVVPHYLRHEEGIEVGSLEPSEPPELATEYDWVGRARRGDSEVTVLIESKTTLRVREVEAFDAKTKAFGAGLVPPLFPVLFAMRIFPAARTRASELGILVVPYQYQSRM